MTYGADMRHFVNTGEMPCVMFGAGDVRLAHAPDESIPIDDLLTAITTTAVFIANWCGSPEPVHLVCRSQSPIWTGLYWLPRRS